MSTPDLALIDTDVASVLYRSGLFQRVMPAELVQEFYTGHFAVVELGREAAVEYGRLRAALRAAHPSRSGALVT